MCQAGHRRRKKTLTAGITMKIISQRWHLLHNVICWALVVFATEFNVAPQLTLVAWSEETTIKDFLIWAGKHNLIFECRLMLQVFLYWIIWAPTIVITFRWSGWGRFWALSIVTICFFAFWGFLSVPV